MIWEFVLLVTTISLLSLRIMYDINKKRPVWLKGPLHLPFIGSGLSIAAIGVTRSFNHIYTEVCKIYGSFCGFFVSSNYFVFVSDPKIAVKILKSEKFESRFDALTWSTHLYRGPNLGVLHSYGETAKNVRTHAITKLKIFGTGKTAWMDSIVQDEVKNLHKIWDKTFAEENKDKDFCMKAAFSIPILKIIFKILSGYTFNDEKKIQSLIDKAENIFDKKAKITGLLFAFPFLRFIPFLTTYKEADSLWTDIRQIFEDAIQQKRDEGNYKENPSNVLESFLQDQEKNKMKNLPYFSDIQIVWICLDIFLTALTSLTARHLEWAVLFITSNNDVYDKMNKEIESELGRINLPNFNDRVRMPYFEAVYLETLRMGSVVSYGMRSPLKTIEFEGYIMPKNCQVMIDNSCIKMNPEVWGNPKTFNPERFLDKNFNIVNTENLYAFGIKRTCLGDSITKVVSFIMLTSLLQRYDIRRSSRSPETSFKPASGIIGRPQTYFIQAELRK